MTRKAIHIAFALTLGLWLLALLAAAVSIWYDPAAINAAIGLAFWAALGTVIVIMLMFDERRRPR